MYKVLNRQHLNKDICLIEFEAGDIAMAARPGQFVILRIDERGERFPLTIYDFDKRKGTVSVVFQAVGVSTKKLCVLKKDSYILDVAGPLGHPVNAKNAGKVICIGGGVGTAEAYPVAKAYKQNNNDVTVIIGAKSRDLVICEKEMNALGVKLYIATDDGTYQEKGFVTDILKRLLGEGRYDLVYAIGPVAMMKAVSEITYAYKIKTLVSLNSIMIDGTGMCGGCRVKYKNESKFTCVDGPEFDAHLVDFDELQNRQNRYLEKEKQALEYHKCRIGLKRPGDHEH